MIHRYDFSTIEPRWQKYWEENNVFAAKVDATKPKYYVLDMFPYPSGDGLHTGHVEGYTATDIIARYKRMKGFSVLHPMGWDAFGLPTERLAVKKGIHPEEVTRVNTATFKEQCKKVGLSYDWDRELSTTDENYYKWTQWIFLKLYEKGLAYLAEVPVNWCPAQGTVLANEEVKDGVYIETGDPVERRMMRQWMMKITAYAERLIDDLQDLDWPEGIKEMQRNWIGKSEGCVVRFRIKDTKSSFDVFTTRPDTLFGTTFCILAPEHPLVDTIVTATQKADVAKYISEAKNTSDRDRNIRSAVEKTGVFTGSYAINPVNGQEIPIWIADYVKIDYATGSVMGVPAHDQRDFDFAKKFNLPIIAVIEGFNGKGAHDGDGNHVNSSFLDGLNIAEAKIKMISWLQEKNEGDHYTAYNFHDWLFSRQRYWGEPFPLAYRSDGSVVTLPEESLPITLPYLTEYKPTEDGRPPLARAGDGWMKIKLNGEELTRETNTMPQWAGSCWYYLRFMDPKNTQAFVGAEAEKYWGPVDLYVGGVEHAVLHLLYSRFWHKVLFDCGLVSTKEPFHKLYNQGMILAQSYRDEAGKFYHEKDIESRGAEYFTKSGGKKILTRIEKMSKSKLNVVNPDEVVAAYGADALRLYEMFMGPLDASKPWQTSGIQGLVKFLERVWSLVVDIDTGSLNKGIQEISEGDASAEIQREINRCISKVTEDIESLRFNTAIAKMMEFVNCAKKQQVLPKITVEKFLLLLAPFAPHLAEELWCRLGYTRTLAYEAFPIADQKWLVDESVTVVLQLNGKKRAELIVPKDASEETVRKIAEADQKAREAIKENGVIKTIFVPNRIFNLIVK